jgi:hypothetical protein
VGFGVVGEVNVFCVEFLARALAVVVLPTQGVTVIRITLFIGMFVERV